MTEAANLFSDGEGYERLMGRWSQRVGAKFLDWLDPPKNLRWIDAGCGNGAFTELLISRCAPAEVIGVDPSEGQLDYARKREGAKRAKFQRADAQSLPFADGSFDAASMALVISFIPDPLKAARELRRVVRSGGIAATYMWDLPGGGLPARPMMQAMDGLGIALPIRPSEDASRREVMRKIWEEAGFSDVATEVLRIRVAFTSFEDFWASNSVPVGPTGAVIAKLPPDARERLRDRLRDTLPIAADGSITYEAFANAVKGRVA